MRALLHFYRAIVAPEVDLRAGSVITIDISRQNTRCTSNVQELLDYSWYDKYLNIR